MTYQKFIESIGPIDYEGEIEIRIAIDNITGFYDKKNKIESYIYNYSIESFTLQEAKNLKSLYNSEYEGLSILIEEGTMFFDIEIVIPFEVIQKVFGNNDDFEDIKEDYFSQLKKIQSNQ